MQNSKLKTVVNADFNIGVDNSGLMKIHSQKQLLKVVGNADFSIVVGNAGLSIMQTQNF